ncbi:3-ketoacyl-CoA synthase 7 [Abeliophyllum distichum]|uniref:3-ketoacyl-CoA synthase 7 n=1 Tax=Abeliophyllum distichum TaxID=126358 RepID=A0ABD1RPW8_9LAMI
MKTIIFDQTSLSDVIIIFFTQFNHLAATSLILAFIIYILSKSNRVYLLDFTCFLAPDSDRLPISTFIEHTEFSGKYNTISLDFQRKVVERSGIGNETCLPPGIHFLPFVYSLNATMEEVKTVFSLVKNLMTKHNINPRSIDILITNCSLTSPTPSLASLIINKFGLRSNVKSFNLSGMGCSAGILSISLARDLLKVHKNSLALILSMESMSSNVYQGNVKSMLLANCLFRMGGAGILLSNKK